MDNGGPGGGTKSASDNYPLVTWGGGEDLSRRVRWQQCLPMLSQSWFLARKCNTASFLCRPHTKRGRIRRREARLRVAEWGGDRARAGERRIYVSNSTSSGCMGS